MSNQAEVNSREITLGENVIILTVLYYFFKQEKQISKVGFDAVARNFSASIIGIRAQWFMDGQPNTLVVKENNRPSIVIKVNKNGWLDYGGEKDNCYRVWQDAMSTNLSFMNQPIAVLEIKKEIKGEMKDRFTYLCRFSLVNGEGLDYQMNTGKVSVVSMKSY
jgi:hypothetical protein